MDKLSCSFHQRDKMTIMHCSTLFLCLLIWASYQEVKSAKLGELMEELKNAISLEEEQNIREREVMDPSSWIEEMDQPISRDLEKRAVKPYTSIPCTKNGKTKGMPLSKLALSAHNILRKKHGVPGLKWDNNLAIAAEAWGKKVAAAGTISHSPESQPGAPNKVGENVAQKGLAFKGVWGPRYLVYMWYSEYWNPGFNFKDPESAANKGAGHFSQIVWKSTKKVGCAEVTADKGEGETSYLVCQYDPPANMKGQYAANVPDLTSGNSIPKSPMDLSGEGCVDYSDQCQTAYDKGWCKLSFVRECCCDKCKSA